MGFRESVYGVLGIKPAAAPKEVVVKIRNEMLDDLGRYETTNYKGLFMKIFVADDIDKLWHMRPDLLVALKETLGEDKGTERMATITDLFVGLHPAAKRSKSSR